MNKIRNILIAIVLGILFICANQGSSAVDRFNGLLRDFQLYNAEKYLESDSSKFKKTKLKECWAHLGDAYYANCQYIKALSAYNKSSSPKRNFRDPYNLAGWEYLALNNYAKTKECFYKTGYLEMLNKVRLIEKGHRYLTKKDYDKALEIFQKSGRLEVVAGFYGKRADAYLDEGDTDQAKTFYEKAVREYENILKSFHYWWNDGCNTGRLRCILALDRLSRSGEEKAKQEKLKTILQGTGRYCRKLREESIYFYCRESVREAIDYSILGSSMNLDMGATTLGFSKPSGRKLHKYIYDYQLLQNKGNIKENRKLMWSNDKRKLKQDEWQTRSIVFKNIIFGPIGIFGFRWQPHYHYKIIGATTFKGKKTVIVEGIPKFPLKINPMTGKALSFGKAWIKADDFTVLKIEWMPKSLGNNLNMRKIARAIKKRPALSFTTEFLREKGGIRYPSRSYYQEYFLDKKGKKSTFVSMDIEYEKFKFFMVEAQVTGEE
ncbi:hypothetical protein ACFLRB_01170 [Acidobacteriota bacterium]